MEAESQKSNKRNVTRDALKTVCDRTLTRRSMSNASKTSETPWGCSLESMEGLKGGGCEEKEPHP